MNDDTEMDMETPTGDGEATESEPDMEPPKGEKRTYEKPLKINTTFNDALRVLVGKKPEVED